MPVQKSMERSPRSRNLKPLLMLLFSLALGAVGVFYSRTYIQEQVAFYRNQLETTETLVKVVVPTHDIPRGEVITQQDLALRDVPTQYVDANNVNGSNFENAIGQRLEYDVSEGRPLQWSHLEGGLTPPFSGTVESGLRAMTVRVDEINSISGFLQPKDKVDLLLSHGANAESQIFPLIQKLNVIATGVQTMVDKQSGGRERSFNTITVHVSPEQAQKITLAQQVGRLTAVLRNPEDDGSLADSPITVANLFNIPDPEPLKPKKRRSRKPSIEYIVEGR